MSNRVICYRPEMNAVWGGTLPNLFVEQVKFWWDAMGRKPFYKFNDKPNKPNKFYKEGDSWQEEMGWSRTELESARDAVAFKATPKDDKVELLKKHVVVYWRDSKNRLWYALSEEIYYTNFNKIYGIKQEPEEPDEKPEKGKAADEKDSQPEPPATTPECSHSAFANADIRQPDNNIDDSSDVNNNDGIPENPIKKDDNLEPPWMKEVFEEGEEPPFIKPSQVKRLKLEWRELWEKNGYPPIFPLLRNKLVNLIEQVGEDIYKEALEVGVLQDKKNFAYIERVALNKHQEAQSGEKSPPQVKPGGQPGTGSGPEPGTLSKGFETEVAS